MKKYLIKIALFFAIVAVADYSYGKICDYLRDHTKGGFSGNVHYICDQCNEDIIMMGSSRMRHHYVPQVFEDSLGMTCYNAGIDGNGIILSYGFLEMILQRYSPKLIFYDVTGYDMYVDDNTKYLNLLKPYYYKAGIDSIFYDVQASERWKMMSGMYRYNSDLFGLIGDNIHPLQQFDKGYWPSFKVMDYEPKEPNLSKQSLVDSLKLEYVAKFIDLAEAKGVQLIFSASPTYFGAIQTDYHVPVKAICESKGVLFVDNYYDKKICGSKEYWADATHLNDKGANLFSSNFATLTKKVIKNQNSR